MSRGLGDVYKRQILYEMEGVDESIAREALTLAAAKLPVGTKFVQRRSV